MWKIKKIVSKGDYNYVHVPDHPKKYVLEHRIVMENHLGRLLNSNEVVHHKDGNKKNNDISNLEVMDKKEHNRLHSSIGRKMVELKCPNCRKVFVREQRQTHISKNGQFTACSPSCRGKFSRKIQLQGKTIEVEKAISGNILRQYRQDNPEETD